MIHRRLNNNHNYNRRQSSWIDIVVLALAWLACSVRGDLLLSRWWAQNPLGKKIRESRRRLHPTSAVTNSLRTHHDTSTNASSKSEGLVGDKRIVRDMARNNLALLQLSH
jgi:hypothetical protein